jgi:hypothetical protein
MGARWYLGELLGFFIPHVVSGAILWAIIIFSWKAGGAWHIFSWITFAFWVMWFYFALLQMGRLIKKSLAEKGHVGWSPSPGTKMHWQSVRQTIGTALKLAILISCSVCTVLVSNWVNPYVYLTIFWASALDGPIFLFISEQAPIFAWRNVIYFTSIGNYFCSYPEGFDYPKIFAYVWIGIFFGSICKDSWEHIDRWKSEERFQDLC